MTDVFFQIRTFGLVVFRALELAVLQNFFAVAIHLAILARERGRSSSTRRCWSRCSQSADEASGRGQIRARAAAKVHVVRVDGVGAHHGLLSAARRFLPRFGAWLN